MIMIIKEKSERIDRRGNNYWRKREEKRKRENRKSLKGRKTSQKFSLTSTESNGTETINSSIFSFEKMKAF